MELSDGGRVDSRHRICAFSRPAWNLEIIPAIVTAGLIATVLFSLALFSQDRLPTSANNLGEENYNRAARLIEKDRYIEAATAYTVACDNLYAKACTDLGVMYRRGQGVRRSYPKAAELLLRGCDGGNGLGCSDLGLMYWEGVMPKDDHRAVALFQRGCDEGDNNGCRVLGFMYEKGQGVTKDQTRAALFYQRAREHRIPFTAQGGLILIETTVNGAATKLIVDTGGTTAFGMRFLPPAKPLDAPAESLDSLHGSSAVYPITVVWTLDGGDKQMPPWQAILLFLTMRMEFSERMNWRASDRYGLIFYTLF